VTAMNNVYLKASKTRVGYPSCDFVGYTLSEGKVRVLEDNLQPLRDCVEPDDVPSLRRVLGLFLVSKNFVKNYASRVAVLNRLTGKVKWQWTSVERKAFNDLRDAILSRPAIYAPDYDLPFRGQYPLQLFQELR